MDELRDPEEAVSDEPFEWGIGLPGAECRNCKRLGRPRVVKQDSNGDPLARPYRHFTCERIDCPHFVTHRRHYCWQAEIPLNSLFKRPRRYEVTPV